MTKLPTVSPMSEQPQTTREMLTACNSLFGPLGPEVIARIQAFLKSPTERNWNDAYTIILRDGKGFRTGLTFWQAWIAVDPKAPRSRGGSWRFIPDRFTAYKALQYAARAKGGR